jgi:hypothetical protein
MTVFTGVVMEVIKKLWAWALGFCTICGGLYAFVNHADDISDFKRRMASLDKMASIESRLAALEASKQIGTAGEGPRGADAKPGKQGEAGPQGERGPKGDAGITPQQVADFDKRIASLERKPLSNQVASADPTQAVSEGIRKLANGCTTFASDFLVTSFTVKKYDRFCSSDGQTISYVNDVRGGSGNVIFAMGDKTYACSAGGTCAIPADETIIYKAKKFNRGLDHDSDTVELEFKRR